MAYSILVDDIDNDDELPVVLAVVDEGDPPDLDESLERLQITGNSNKQKIRLRVQRAPDDAVYEERERERD